jgi:predicted Na+-dependent transporter
VNIYSAIAIVDVAIISLVGFGIYYTHDPWVLLGLLFLVSIPENENKYENGDN